VTLWYRAPELLLGAREYTAQVDIWSIGCVFIDLLLNENLLKGENESRQIEKIYELCGSPDIKSYPEVSKLQFWKDLKPRRSYERRLREELTNKKKDLDAEVINFIDEIMVINPLKRLSIEVFGT
jgi:cyclin-dependent kinase 12/13